MFGELVGAALADVWTRAGKPGDTEIRKYRRQQIWSRFENLEKGLMSNGVARQTITDLMPGDQIAYSAWARISNPFTLPAGVTIAAAFLVVERVHVL